MSRIEKTSWGFAIFYFTGTLFFFILRSSFAEPLEEPYLPLIVHSCLLLIFYFGMVKRQLFFSALSIGWLVLGNLKALYTIYLLITVDGRPALLSGALMTFSLMVIWTYFTLRAFLTLMKQRSFIKSRL